MTQWNSVTAVFRNASTRPGSLHQHITLWHCVIISRLVLQLPCSLCDSFEALRDNSPWQLSVTTLRENSPWQLSVTTLRDNSLWQFSVTVACAGLGLSHGDLCGAGPGRGQAATREDIPYEDSVQVKLCTVQYSIVESKSFNRTRRFCSIQWWTVLY